MYLLSYQCIYGLFCVETNENMVNIPFEVVPNDSFIDHATLETFL